PREEGYAPSAFHSGASAPGGGTPMSEGSVWKSLGGLSFVLACARSEERSSEREACSVSAERLAGGAPLTRAEVAAHLGVSYRKVQRMEAAGLITRCPNMGAAVRYPARDVLRLASAR